MSEADAPHDPKVELEQAVGDLARLRKILADQKADAVVLQEQIAQLQLSLTLALTRENVAKIVARISEMEELVRNLAADIYHQWGLASFYTPQD